MPKVAMVAHRLHTSQFLSEMLQELVGPRAEVVGYCLDQGMVRIDADLAVVSTPEVMSWLGPWLSPTLPMVTLKRTITRAAWEMVMRLPPRTLALVVNDTEETAVETVALLHELGAAHLKLKPFWPGLQVMDSYAVAITPGEARLVPAWVEQVIDLGPRVVDPSTAVDVLTMLNRYDGEAHNRLLAYTERVMPKPSLTHTLNWFSQAKAQLEIVLDEIQEGVVACDARGMITLVNRRAEVLLGREGWKLVGQPLQSVTAEVGLDLSGLFGNRRAHHVVDLGSRQVVVHRRSLGGSASQWGSILLLRDMTEIQDLEKRLRQELKTRGHTTRYSFASIIGPSAAIRSAVRKAEKLAPASGAVLIQGESGTGKELFAHAIHAASPRARFPFVAINCAAVPETLLESELFGYEEGAFTGARRGGKEGLFEQAHKGTIFLDEIGDMAPQLQGRLLRVLQEKEVLRVGGTRLRTVDVRVISATHKDLAELVRQGQFRADLYHRLNVLTLRVPTLRERKEDIPALIQRFLADMNAPEPVPDELLAALQRYDWPGNVRELHNCLEYMVQVAEGPLTLSALPTTVLDGSMGWPVPDQSWPPEKAGSAGQPPSLLVAGSLPDETAQLRFLLSALLPSPLGRRTGRRTLMQMAAAKGLHLSEAQIRRRLEKLAAAGLITLRHGSSPALTGQGEAYLRQLTEEELGRNRATGL